MSLVLTALALVAAAGALGAALYMRRAHRAELAVWVELAENLRRDVELERLRSEAAIGALNIAREALGGVASGQFGAEARAFGERALVSSVMGSARPALEVVRGG